MCVFVSQYLDDFPVMSPEQRRSFLFSFEVKKEANARVEGNDGLLIISNGYLFPILDDVHQVAVAACTHLLRCVFSS